MKNYTTYLISNKPVYYTQIANSLSPEPLKYFDGTGYDSFSKLVNSCVSKSSTEIVIMMSDKVLPQSKNIQSILNLINEGYGFVGLYRFGFFGFKKELLRQIGMMDERYIGGGYEDNDMYIRLKEANIGAYISHEVPYEKRQSGWGDYSEASEFFFKKWGTVKEGFVKRNLQEEKYQYNLGPNVKTKFLPWSESKLLAKKLRPYKELIIRES